MQKKEVKKWQDEEALERYRMIAPLLDKDLDEGKRRQMREEAAEKNGISKRSLYRYEERYRKADPFTFKITKDKLYFTIECKEAFWTTYHVGMVPKEI